MKTLIYLLIPAFLLTIAFAQAPPPPELKDPFLDNFVGDWRVERKMGNGRIAESTVYGEWSLKHHYIQLHYGFADSRPTTKRSYSLALLSPKKLTPVTGSMFMVRVSTRPVEASSITKNTRLNFGGTPKKAH